MLFELTNDVSSGFVLALCTAVALRVVFLACITPSAASVVQFAQIHNQDVDFAVSVNVAASVVGIATIPIFVWLFCL